MIIVNSLNELQWVLKEYVVFALLVVGSLSNPETLLELRKIFAACPKIKRVFYGNVLDEELAFQLSKIGCDEYLPIDWNDKLLGLLHEWRSLSTFDIHVRIKDFGINLDQCTNIWICKFLKFVMQDNNFLEYTNVKKIAEKLNISQIHLNRVFNLCNLSPKQWLYVLRAYYAAYLLHIWPHVSAKEIALECKFKDEHQFYKLFKKLTGISIKKFRLSYHWSDFASLFLQKHGK